MKEFVLIFRNSVNTNAKPSPEQMQQVMTSWMDWLGSLSAQNKLVDRGNRLSMSDSKTVKSDSTVTDGPFTEIKEYINGYTIIRATGIDEAVALAKDCPILKVGGQVEVRAVVSPDDNS